VRAPSRSGGQAIAKKSEQGRRGGERGWNLRVKQKRLLRRSDENRGNDRPSIKRNARANFGGGKREETYPVIRIEEKTASGKKGSGARWRSQVGKEEKKRTVGGFEGGPDGES